MRIVNLKPVTTVTDVGIYGFFGDYHFLSNMHPAQVILDRIVYPTSEHAYVSEKTHNISLKHTIAMLPSGHDAKAFGRTVQLREGWNSYKITAMRRILVIKFQDPVLRQKLLDTGDLYLEETNTWQDTFWGVYRGTGMNMLGKLLMSVRNEIRNPPEHLNEPPLFVW